METLIQVIKKYIRNCTMKLMNYIYISLLTVGCLQAFNFQSMGLKDLIWSPIIRAKAFKLIVNK